MALVAAGSGRYGQDRTALLVVLGLIWLGVLVGFGGEILKQGFDYPLIVHLHAVVFFGWLLLLSAQIWLIRIHRADLHRRLGVMVACWAALMVVIGPATAITMDALHFQKGGSPVFLAVQLTDILAFSGLVGAGLLFRRHADAHKRLMLLSTVYISDAGFARWLGPWMMGFLPAGNLHDWVGLYGSIDLLLIGFGLYDLVSHRRLYPAWLAGALWMACNQTLALVLLGLPVWKPVALKLIGQ